mmetsp:Transcript_177385/g.568796  ORF Transcript_177385/g.568796 Transcript_177385/m.568796 type:complete len:368 (-) Transcript_177385:2563-3666(-)
MFGYTWRLAPRAPAGPVPRCGERPAAAHSAHARGAHAAAQLVRLVLRRESTSAGRAEVGGPARLLDAALHAPGLGAAAALRSAAPLGVELRGAARAGALQSRGRAPGCSLRVRGSHSRSLGRRQGSAGPRRCLSEACRGASGAVAAQAVQGRGLRGLARLREAGAGPRAGRLPACAVAPQEALQAGPRSAGAARLRGRARAARRPCAGSGCAVGAAQGHVPEGVPAMRRSVDRRPGAERRAGPALGVAPGRAAGAAPAGPAAGGAEAASRRLRLRGAEDGLGAVVRMAAVPGAGQTRSGHRVGLRGPAHREPEAARAAGGGLGAGPGRDRRAQGPSREAGVRGPQPGGVRRRSGHGQGRRLLAQAGR